ncbi:histone deacetylase [bacterium]|nr:histone deacetylase [bacterium]
MSTALFFHDSFLRHDTGPFHPENPERLRAILNGLKEAGLWEGLTHITPEPADEEEILLCHPIRHLEFIRECSRRGSFQIDPDTHVSSHSYEAAMRAAGAAVQAVDCILSGKVRNAFAAVRPPGHHATTERAMGFCLFNNIAIAARHAVKNHGLQRVLIMDWDVHHGNGTQDIFYDDASVVYVSLHKGHHYPGTGWEEEDGEGVAQGTNINIPFTRVPGPEIYEENFRQALARIHNFRPEFIFISCGFDAHERDPLGNLGLKNETYGRLTEILIDFAGQFDHERVFSILEGGYDYKALAASAAAHVERLMNYRPSHD